MLNVKEQKKEAAQDANVATKEQRSNKYEVKIVSISGDKLAVTNKAGKAYSYRLAKDARITWEGKPRKAEDLKAGCEILVTTKQDDRNQVIEIESIEKDGEAEGCRS